MIKDIVVVAIIVVSIFGGIFYINSRIETLQTLMIENSKKLGVAAGTEHYFNETFPCIKIYQRNATTLASTTLYLMASTTTSTPEIAFFRVIATTTKPSICGN